MTSRKLRFLLAEDDEDHATLIRRNLLENIVGCVDHVVDGVEVMAFLRKEGKYADCKKPDVILLDLNMPRMNGHEVLTALKDDEEFRSIPVVILTTSDAESDRARAYCHYANSYIVKPIDLDQFSKMTADLSRYWGIWNRPFAER